MRKALIDVSGEAGRACQRLREKTGKVQSEVVRKVNLERERRNVGQKMTEGWLSRFESGESPPSFEKVCEVLYALGKDLWDLETEMRGIDQRAQQEARLLRERLEALEG